MPCIPNDSCVRRCSALEARMCSSPRTTSRPLSKTLPTCFCDRTPDRRRWLQAETWDKGHGRLEHRQITCSPDLNDWFARQWPGIEQVFRVERITCILKTGESRHQVV